MVEDHVVIQRRRGRFVTETLVLRVLARFAMELVPMLASKTLAQSSDIYKLVTGIRNGRNSNTPTVLHYIADLNVVGRDDAAAKLHATWLVNATSDKSINKQRVRKFHVPYRFIRNRLPRCGLGGVFVMQKVVTREHNGGCSD